MQQAAMRSDAKQQHEEEHLRSKNSEQGTQNRAFVV